MPGEVTPAAADGAPLSDTGTLGARAAAGGRWVAASALVSNGAAAVVLLVLAAVLPPRDLGVLALATVVFMIGNIVQDFGLFDGLVYAAERVQETAETVLLCWLVAGAVLGALVAVTSPQVAGFFGEERAAPVIAVAGLLLLCHAAAGVPIAMWTRALDLRRRSIAQLSSVLGGAVTTLVLVALGLGIGAMVAGQVVQAVLILCWAWGHGPRLRPRWHPEAAREVFAYGRHSFGASLTTVLQTNIDYVFVGRVLGASALGVYSFAFRIAYLPHAVVSTVVASTLFALLCRLDGRDGADAVLRYVRAVLLLVTPLVVGLALFAPAVTLLGAEWSTGVEALRWLALFCLLTSVVTLTVSGLKGVGRPSLAFAVAAAHLGLLVVLLLATTGRGVDAVAVSRAVAAGLAALLGWVGLTRAARLPATALLRLLALPLLGAAAMTAIAVALPFAVAGGEPVTWFGVLPQAVATLGGYGVAVGLADRAALKEAARGALRRNVDA